MRLSYYSSDTTTRDIAFQQHYIDYFMNNDIGLARPTFVKEEEEAIQVAAYARAALNKMSTIIIRPTL